MSETPTRHRDDTVHPPDDLTPIGSVRYRERAAVRGTVAAARGTRWTGGPVLEPNPARPRYLVTGPGMGYRFTG